MSLKIPAESGESLEIVSHSLSELVYVYQILWPTTDNFVKVMSKIKETVMGLDTWEVVKQRVTKEMAKSMFNFKEGLKRKMLKVQYLKHPNIAFHLYDKNLVASRRRPWNDEVPVYFEKLFYVELFLGMKPNYNDFPSEFFGPRKGRLCGNRGIKSDIEFPCPKPPLVS